MDKVKFFNIVSRGVIQGKKYLAVKIKTEDDAGCEIIINPSENFKTKMTYYNMAYNFDMELISAKERGKLIQIIDVLMTDDCYDLMKFVNEEKTV